MFPGWNPIGPSLNRTRLNRVWALWNVAIYTSRVMFVPHMGRGMDLIWFVWAFAWGSVVHLGRGLDLHLVCVGFSWGLIAP